MADVSDIITKLAAVANLPDLRVGDGGTNVKVLQTGLNTLGARLTVDGQYGEKSGAAVSALRDVYGLGAGGFDAPLRSALGNDLQAGPNAGIVLRAINAGGGLPLPPSSPNQVSVDDLAAAANELLQAGLTGASPSLLAAQTALAFLNYYPATLVGQDTPGAQTAYAQALLAFTRMAFNDPTLTSPSQVAAGELYTRMGQALQQAVAAQGGALPTAGKSKLAAFLTHPLTVIAAAGGLVWWAGGFRMLGLGDGLADLEALAESYGYQEPDDDGDEEDVPEDDTFAGVDLSELEVRRPHRARSSSKRRAKRARRG